MNLRPVLAGIAAWMLGSLASAQVPLPMCNVNATCPVFTAPAFAGDGSRLTNLPGSGGSPTGPAGGDLTGTYPNPTLKASQGNVTAFTNAAGITVISSVSASTYYGDGSHLTGVTSTESNTFTSSKTFTQAVLGLSSITASAFFGDGSHLSGVSTAESNTFTSSKTFTNAVLIGGVLTGSTGTFSQSVTAEHLYSNGDATMFASLIVAGPDLRASAATFNVHGDSVAIGSLTVDPGAKLHINGTGTEAPLIVTSGASDDFTGVILGNTSAGTAAATGIDLESDDGSAQIALAGSNNVSPGAASKLVIANGSTLILVSTFNTTSISGTVTASTFNAVGSAYQMGGVTVIDHNRNVFASSVTASAFFGDGSHLTGILATSVASGGVDFSTITAALNTKLSSGAIPSGFVDLSTVTTALATKASSGTDNTLTRLNALTTIGSAFTALSSMTNISAGGVQVVSSVTAGAFFGDGSHLSGVTATSVASGGVDFSTITASLNTKLSSGAVPSGFIDLSTVTTALATKASSGTDNTLTRLNALTTIGSAFTELSSMTNISAGGIQAISSVTAGAFFGDGSHLSGVTATSVASGGVDFSTITASLNTKLSSGAIPSGFVDLSTVTTALATKASSGTDNTLTRLNALNTIGSAFTSLSSMTNVSANGIQVVSSVTAGAYFGDGSHLTGVTATSVASGGVDFSTITASLNTKLSSGAIPSGFVDLSTVTTALATKASSGTDNTLSRLNALTTIGSAFTSLSSMTNTSANGIQVISSVTAGAYFGDGSHLTGVTATSVASGGVDFSTITASLNTKLSSGAIPSGFVDLSTVTTALAGKLSITGTAVAVASGGVDFSTITTSLNTKLSSGAIPSGFVDLSTVTTALATKASSGTDNTLTRLNALNTIGSAVTVLSSMTNTSANGIQVVSSVTAGAFFGDGSHLTGVAATSVASGGVDFSTITTSLNTKLSSGAVPSGFIDLSTVTTALATKASTGTDNSLSRLNALNAIGSAFTEISSMTNTSANGILVNSSVTAGGFYGNGFGLTGVKSVLSGGVDFSTITTSLNTKLSSGAVPSGFIDLSTVTTALATRASSGTDNTLTRLNALQIIDGAVGFTETSSMTNTSTNGILVNSSVTAGGFYGNGFGLTGVKSVLSGGVDFSTITTSLNTKLSSGAVPSGFVDLSTVTTALATKASTGTDNTLTRLNALNTIGSAFTALSSMTNTSANGILVTYGVNAASGVYTSSVSVTAGGMSVSTSATAASPAFLVDPSSGNVFITTATFIAGQLNLSTSPTSGFIMQIGKGPTGESYITNATASGAIRFMGGKINPQIILGSAQSTGTGFFDMSSGRPLALQTLSTGVVQIQNLEMQANSSMTVITSLTISGTGAPLTGFALCLASTGKLGHCTSVVGVGGGCTCTTP